MTNTTKPRPRIIAHLVASPFFGGPERQLLGLAKHLSDDYRTEFLSFHERGLAAPFAHAAHSAGLNVTNLAHNAPHYAASIREVALTLKQLKADVLCCHGYKPDIIGLAAGRIARVPVVGVSRGWTGATFKVRINESLDKLSLHGMRRIVCVSEGQARKVRRALVPSSRVTVIRNAIDTTRFDTIDTSADIELRSLFSAQVKNVVIAAGRLSPEKGFDQLIAAAEIVDQTVNNVGFAIFGDGPLHRALTRQIAATRLDNCILAGFRSDVDRFLPHAALVAIPSYTEGLPNIALEAHAAGVPIVATNVGGIPEVVDAGETGHLVSSGDPRAIAQEIISLLSDDALRSAMGHRGREKVEREFTFPAQARAYEQLFDQILTPRPTEKKSAMRVGEREKVRV